MFKTLMKCRSELTGVSYFQASLRVFALLLGLVVLSESACFRKPLAIIEGPGFPVLPTGCEDDDGKTYPFGGTWVRDCKSCSCSTDGMSCCEMLPSAGAFSFPHHCQLLVDKTACTTKLVLKSDNSRPCVV
ncbi:beta-microseminoprotein [Xyrichtys novacula]|uniref:Beta-microseminoprotein n=1 Tax=Xyrichtys novacula TaxID=13765 RepID=A0AAV1G619_XYRNO|nr:beta-microseminoprotein [Xyrichtys novacula]